MADRPHDCADLAAELKPLRVGENLKGTIVPDQRSIDRARASLGERMARPLLELMGVTALAVPMLRPNRQPDRAARSSEELLREQFRDNSIYQEAVDWGRLLMGTCHATGSSCGRDVGYCYCAERCDDHVCLAELDQCASGLFCK